MIARELSLQHLIREPGVPSKHPRLLLLLHGVGSNEKDLFELAPQLDERLLILSVRSPIPLGRDSFGWWRVDFGPNGPRIDPQEAFSARAELVKFIDEAVHAYDADPAGAYLMGFSQGAVLSLTIMLTEPEKIAGVVAMSGRILPDVRKQIVAADRLRNFPVLVVHGMLDNALPIRDGRAARDLLAGLPVNLTYREFPMAHQISAESFEQVRFWMTARLDSVRDQ